MMSLIVALLFNAHVALSAISHNIFDSAEIGESKDRSTYVLARKTIGLVHPWVDPKTLDSCIDLLVATQTRIGRELTEEEVKRLLPSIQVALKKAPTQQAGLADPTNLKGLGTQTRVLTPDGYVAAHLLKVGQEVVSYDKLKRTFVANRVIGIRDAVVIGTFNIQPGNKRLETPLTVGRGQSFFFPHWDRFASLQFMDRSNLLLFTEGTTQQRLWVIPLGIISEDEQDTQILQIELEGKPHNLFADGIMVQSYVPAKSDRPGAE
jgi:hypothetical protein